MSIIKRLTGEIERNQRIADQLESTGLGNSDAARTARSNLRHASQQLKQAEGRQDPPRWEGHP